MPAARDAEGWRSEGNRRFAAGDWPAAAQAYRRALELQADGADTWYRLGNAYQEQRLDAEAAECFERVVALDPGHAQAWNNLGVSREALGKPAQAVQAYRRALAESPSLLPALTNLSYLHMRTDDYTAALPLLESAASRDPADPGIWERLGICLAKLGQDELADRALRTAADRQSARVKPLIDAAQAAIARGDAAEMQRTLAAALEALPGNPALTHMLDAARGRTNVAPPAGYVTALFDDFARNYDEKMRGMLEYRVPELLAQAVMTELREARRPRIVDLGCGTGLLGSALSGLQAELVGIDLSRRMLEHAERLGVYAQLIEGDLVEELRRMPPASAMAVLAADVFVYLGDLRPVFTAVARALAPGGLFAFSVEALAQGDFRIVASGRYAHSREYLCGLAAQFGLAERSIARIQPRRERDSYIEGWLACFAAGAAARRRP